MSNSYASKTSPGGDLVAVTPGTAALTRGTCKRLFIGTGGNISVITEHGNTVADIPVTTGMYLDVRCTHVLVAGSGPATDIYAIY